MSAVRFWKLSIERGRFRAALAVERPCGLRDVLSCQCKPWHEVTVCRVVKSTHRACAEQACSSWVLAQISWPNLCGKLARAGHQLRATARKAGSGVSDAKPGAQRHLQRAHQEALSARALARAHRDCFSSWMLRFTYWRHHQQHELLISAVGTSSSLTP